MLRLVRHLAAILLLPVVVTLFVPWRILRWTHTVRVGWDLRQPWHWGPLVVGIGLIGAGLLLMAQTIRLFAGPGQGTLAPWDPPRRLVVRGVYRYVRNPMISGVFSLVLGEALLFRSWALAIWFLFVVAVNMVYIPHLEEPQLARRFGAQYEDYRRHVPRWFPRRTPWTPREEAARSVL